MAIKRPDIYEHNNPSNAIVDSNFVRGSIRSAVANLTELFSLSSKIDQLKEHSTIVYVSDISKYYILKDIANADSIGGWEEFITGSGTTIVYNGITGATNGLTVTGNVAKLGGELTGNTSITGNYTLNISGNTRLSTDSGYQISGLTVLKHPRIQ